MWQRCGGSGGSTTFRRGLQIARWGRGDVAGCNVGGRGMLEGGRCNVLLGLELAAGLACGMAFALGEMS